MKKYIFLLLAIVSFKAGFGQLDSIRASISAAGNPSNIRIWLMPMATKTPCVFSTLQFNVAIPSTIIPVPTLSFVSSAFVGTTWIVDPPYLEGGYLNYNIYTNNSPSLNTTQNMEFLAMELSFSGGPGGGAATFVNTATLVTHPDGGVGGTGNGFGLFLCTGSLYSNGNGLYYPRSGVLVSNGDSYTQRISGVARPMGTFTSFARLSTAIALPVKFSSFTASRLDNSGLLNWMVENQTANMSHFEIERSFTGSDFARIGRKEAVYSGGNGIYDFTDGGVFNNYSGNVYYRIKQVDRTGEITYSPVRTIKADGKGFGLSLYPNPVVKEANILFTLSEAKQVSLVITDAAGKQYTNITMQAAKGMTQKNIDVSTLSAGTYIVRIVAGDESQTLSFVKSN
jgi:hypothetical protein